MKIGIHHFEGSFSENWIMYCRQNNIQYKLVNCYDSDIIEQLKDCDGLMWHWSHSDIKATHFARQLTHSLELCGKQVFPDTKTCWHFDDKVGQKYLLEAIGAPLVKSYVFYEKEEALKWANQTLFPKIFKLKGGAGSVNVKLVRNKENANKLIHKAFGKGFKLADTDNIFKDRFLRLQKDKDFAAFVNVIKGYVRLFIPDKDLVKWGRSKGYIYFQDYIHDIDHDIRVIVIGKRAFAIKRMVRRNDFRASGSGNIIYNISEIPTECIKIAFFWANKLQVQCVAFDFVKDIDGYKILEISYGFKQSGYIACPGYWDEMLKWHKGCFMPENFIITDFVQR